MRGVNSLTAIQVQSVSSRTSPSARKARAVSATQTAARPTEPAPSPAATCRGMRPALNSSRVALARGNNGMSQIAVISP